MAVKDYYKILRIERTASSFDIKKAYYRLSRLFHPDICGNSPDNLRRFQDISEAYRVLGNLESRLRYCILLNQRFLEELFLYKNLNFPYIKSGGNTKKHYRMVIEY